MQHRNGGVLPVGSPRPAVRDHHPATVPVHTLLYATLRAVEVSDSHFHSLRQSRAWGHGKNWGVKLGGLSKKVSKKRKNEVSKKA